MFQFVSKLIFLALGFFFFTQHVYANGQIEERIALARQLIEDNNLNEAELLLVEIERQDPERQDEVEEMRALIRTSRRGYNDQYAELIRLLNTGGDEERAVEIIRRLEALDSNPNAATAKLIFEAKRTVLFKQSERLFNQLMDEALVLLNRREYLQAMVLYLGGFTIHREIFDGESYGDLVKSSVLRSLNTVENNGQVFISPESAYADLRSRALALAAAEPPADGVGPWSEILLSFSQVQNLYWDSFKALSEIRQQSSLISEAAGLARGDPYLTFMNGLISGRDLSGRTEGFLGALSFYWSYHIESWTTALSQSIDTGLAAALTDLQNGRWAQASAGFTRAALRSRTAQTVLSQWNSWFFELSAGQIKLRPDMDALIVQTAAAYERLRISREIGIQGNRLAGLRSGLGAFIGRELTQESEILTAASLSRTSREEASGLLNRLQGDATRRTALNQAGVQFDTRQETPFIGEWQTQIAYMQNAEITFYDRRATLIFPPLETAAAQVEAQFSQARALFQGTIRTDESGLQTLVRFPREASIQLRQVSALSQTTRQAASAFLADFQRISTLVNNSGVIQGWITKAQNLLARLGAQDTLVANLLPQSDTLANEASAFLSRARQSLVSAQSANAQERFSQARETLSEAQSLWEASFLRQEDEPVRTDLERQRVALATAIYNGEREQVAREVRTLITQGSQAYLQSRFTQAEEILLRARDRWADTENEENIEVEQWLGLTRNALTFSSGRELARTDPLYFEIQPLLNFAVQDYERARILIEQNNQVEARSLLQRASARLQQVRIPFPLNQTAGVLDLRILKLSATPADFESAFATKVEQARTLAQRNPTQALADLQDLAEIQPNFPGLVAFIRTLRIEVGIDRPPPNPADLARSRQLTGLAAQIVNSNQFIRFPEARTRVEEALRLDPTNIEAQRLLDKIIATGPRTGASSVLTAQERASLNQASVFVNQGRFFEAKAILDRLLAVPKNRTNSEIKKLESAVNARIRT